MVIRIPAPSSMLVANLLAVLGLLGFVTAIGGLAGVLWALLVGSLIAVGLGWLGMLAASKAEQAAAAAAAAEHQAPVAGAPVRAVEEPAAA